MVKNNIPLFAGVVFLTCIVFVFSIFLGVKHGIIKEDFIGNLMEGISEKAEDVKDDKPLKPADKYMRVFTGQSQNPESGWKTYEHGIECSKFNNSLGLKNFSINYPDHFRFDTCAGDYRQNYVGFYNYDDFNYIIDNVNLGALNADESGNLTQSQIHKLIGEVVERFERDLPAGTAIYLMDNSDVEVSGVSLVRRDYEVLLGDEFNNFAKGRFNMRLVAYPSPEGTYGLLFLSFAEIDSDSDFTDAVSRLEALYLNEMMSSVRFVD